MARHLARGLCLAALAAALALEGCAKQSPASLERTGQPGAARGAAVDPPSSAIAARSSNTSEKLPAIGAPRRERYPTDDPPPWLAELLHASDPNVRVQALDAWARQPGESLDPVTYALVDPDETVRARAQEVLERELARR